MELLFDKMTVDTSLAQSFLKSIRQEELLKSNFIYDGKQFYKTLDSHQHITDKFLINVDKIKDFIEKLKDNIDLLAQLEYLLREVPIEDSKVQVNLIIQYVNYISFTKRNLFSNKADVKLSYNEKSGTVIKMSKDMPLLMLGHTMVALLSNNFICIHIDESTAATSILFTRLCCEAGLPVLTIFGNEYKKCQSTYGLTVPLGALGVVTECSDVDSAVDAFLNSSLKAPWRLQRIFVQESVSQQFRDTLVWKCNLKELPNTLEYNGKLFLLDELGMKDPKPTEVYVNTYRTIKELLSLLSEHPSGYLSLWANNIAVINEIIYLVPSQIVWVNNLADFRGPVEITAAFYDHIEPDVCVIKLRKHVKMNELAKIKSSWLKLNHEARRQIIIKTLISCDDLKELCYSLENYIKGCVGGFVYTGKDYVCSAVPTVSKKLFFIESGEEAVYNIDFFESIALGNGFVLYSNKISDNFKKILAKITNAGMPVIYLDKTSFIDLNVINDMSDNFDDFTLYKLDARSISTILPAMQSTKVIWTNSGTTFAN